MRARGSRVLNGLALVVAMALCVPVAAQAQTPTPTPTPSDTATATPTPSPTPTASPTPTPTPEPAKQNKYTRRVYRDFKRDGLIDACTHSKKALKRTLKTITPEFEDAYPDFRDAVKAAIKQHDKHRCVQAKPTPTPAPTTAPVPSTPSTPSTPAPAPVAPVTPSTPAPAPVVPVPKPPKSSTPVPPLPTPTATPTPAPTPPPPSAAQQEAQAIVSRPHDRGSLLVPAILLGLALLGAAGAAGSAVLGNRVPRFAGVGHAWREAAFRAGGTWGSFTDWMRLGR